MAEVADAELVENTYKFEIKMTCSGCSGAIDRVLKKLKENGDVSSYSVDLEKQEAIAKGRITLDDLRLKLAKTGKEIKSAEVVEDVV